jgi:hypothetical protein
MRRKSRTIVCRAISDSAPASSAPVGPAPMIANVRNAACFSGSVSRSAASNASSTRRRISSASSIVFSPGAFFSHSSWPKYECVAPVAITRKSYESSPSASCTTLRFRSTAIASPRITRVFFCLRRMPRIGVAMSLGLRPAVAT